MFLLSDIEQCILVYGRRWSFPLQLEHHDTIIMACSKQVNLRMCGEDPESIILSLEGLHRSPFIEVPDADGFVPGAREEVPFSDCQHPYIVLVPFQSAQALQRLAVPDLQQLPRDSQLLT